MSRFSRVKKNSDLYNEIIEEDKTKIIESSLRDYERRTTDPHSNESKYQASRYRKNKEIIENLSAESKEKLEEMTEEPQVDEVLEESINNDVSKDKEELSKKEILRDRDLLEEFIEEVKHYNINRGLRNVQDTQMNILQNLNKNPKTKEKENEVIESTEETVKSDQELTQEIQAIISDLDNNDVYYEDDVDNEVVDDFVFTPLDKEKEEKISSILEDLEDDSNTSKKSEVNKKVNEKAVFSLNNKDEDQTKENDENESLPIKVETVDEESKRDFKSSELLELTQTLNLKLDLQEAELEEVSHKVSVIDKILTIFVVLLVIALVFIIVYGVYWVYIERGGF